MSETDLFDEMIYLSSKNADGNICVETTSSKQPPCMKRDAKFLREGHADEEFSGLIGNWYEVLSSLNNVNAKQAWRNGTVKLSQTLNNVRNTFGVISQRIKKSTKERQSLINMESPRTPITPYTRSRAVLGRTPIKLYSPFSIDTPTGEENKSDRFLKDENHLVSSITKVEEKKLRRTRLDLSVTDDEKERKQRKSNFIGRFASNLD